MKRIAALSLIAVAACSAATSTPITQVTGTWGGDNAGMIVADNDVHVHIGCTLGDALGPVRPDAEGHFVMTGTYNVDAYPINRGITHPATFSGQVVGQTLTLTVSLDDITRVLGPVTLTYGKEPQMGPCPICRVPKREAGGGKREAGSALELTTSLQRGLLGQVNRLLIDGAVPAAVVIHK